jgi:hypothetical protein
MIRRQPNGELRLADPTAAWPTASDDGGPAGWWGTGATAQMTMYRSRSDYKGARAMYVYVILAVLFVILAFGLVRVRGRKAGRS